MKITFRETLTGTYTRTDIRNESRPFVVTLRGSVADLWAFARTGRIVMDGGLNAPGLATHVATRGSLALKPAKGQMVYEFSFRGDDGRQHCFEGQKQGRFTHPFRSFEELPGTIRVADEVVARSTLTFKIRKELLPMLRSFELNP